MLDCLRFYTDMGWPLLPCSALSKAPLTAHGFKDASTDWRQVEEWYKQYPACAWGVATSAERAALDVDPRHGGDKQLARLEAENGALPPTPKVLTGGGGAHFWLAFPPGTKCGKPFPGIDRKAEGGYVIVPPSRILIPKHGGRPYAWEVRPWEVPLAEAPAWLLGMKPSASADADEAKADDPFIVRAACLDLLSHSGLLAGKRRVTLCPLVAVHLARGGSTASIMAMAEAWASRCKPPFDGRPEPNDHWRKHTLGMIAKDEAKAGAGRMTTSLPLPPVRVSIREVGGGLDASERTKVAADDVALLVSSQAGGDKADWPTLPVDAYHGLLGEMLRAVEPETEADPAGV